METLRGVLQTFAIDAVKAQAESLRERMAADTEFLKAVAELKASSAARTLGKRGGKRSGEVRSARAQARKRAVCAVCEHNREGATREVIRWHLAGHPAGRAMPESVRASLSEGENQGRQSQPEAREG